MDDVFPSNFLKGDDLQGRTVVVTIASIQRENVATDENPEHKAVAHFVGKQKGMVINKTNWQLLQVFCGSEESDDWIGQTLLLWNDRTVMYKGELTGGLRFKGVAEDLSSDPPPPLPPPPASNDDIPF